MKHFSLKRWIYTLFEKSENKKSKKSDELAQPKGASAPTANNKNEKRNSILKKVGIASAIIIVGGAIITLAAVFGTRKTEIALKEPEITYNSNVQINGKTQNLIGFQNGLNNNAEKYYVNFSQDNTPLLASYYTLVANNNQIEVKIQTENSLPILFNVSKTEFGNGYTRYNFGGDTWIIANTFNQVMFAQLINNGTKELISFSDSKNSNSPQSSTDGKNANAEPTKASGLEIYQANATNLPTSNPLYSILYNLVSSFSGAFTNGTNPPAQFNWAGLISVILPIIIIIAIIWYSSSAMKKQMGNGESIFGMGKTNLKPAKTKVRFSDVAGIDEVETELREIVDYVKNPKKYAVMGARAPKGILLYGPPGTGKTLIAKAVAGEADCSFYAISGSSFEDMLVGVGAKRVRDLFSKARKDSPSIIFIDEIDAVASKRGKNDIIGGGGGVADQTINQLLTELDGFATDAGVVVIGATNRLDSLDEAILRPGRFDRQIQVTLPDIKGREAILKIHSRNKNLSSKVNLKDIARRTAGFSGAQLENVMNEAVLLAVRSNKTVVTMEDIDEGIDRTIGGPARKGRAITEEERRQIAYHEGGHALIGLHAKNTDVVEKITIIPRGNAAGYTMQTPANQEMTIQRKEDLLNQVRMTLGGRAAEEVIFGKHAITTGAANDLYKVSQIVRAMVLQMGMSTRMGLTQYVPSEGQQPYQKLYSEQTAREIDETIESIIQNEYRKAKEIIINNRRELDLIAKTLLILETIVKPQIDYIHEHLEFPPEVTQEHLDSYAKRITEESQEEPKVDNQDEHKSDQDENNSDDSSSNDSSEQDKKPDDNSNV